MFGTSSSQALADLSVHSSCRSPLKMKTVFPGYIDLVINEHNVFTAKTLVALQCTGVSSMNVSEIEIPETGKI
jgi:hypothetical protein